MGILAFRCQRASDYIFTGIETDERSIASSRAEAMRVYCPRCREEHELPLRFAVLLDEADVAA